MKIFLIGPGGVGKSTVGKILSKKIKYDFIDLDSEFCHKIGNVTEYINTQGYEKYYLQNSKLFYNLLNKISHNTIMVLSSGFLVYKGLSKKHYQTIKKNGISVLLLPSKSIKETIGIIVKRQLKRGFNLKKQKEEEKIKERFNQYKKLGDIKVFSCDQPEIIANIIKNRIKDF